MTLTTFLDALAFGLACGAVAAPVAYVGMSVTDWRSARRFDLEPKID